ncbi:cysteine hydrolase family protein [Psychrobacillus psychrodurans]|uniref:cysteine hydrolase family protein n=1 Tax=Psychrobacillus psychrodurans TaxID=126157 RepID=UPI0008DFF0C1|nr:isochorismatase family cysteine hydrolase [Psychrobacillus psychrodurans]MCZ8541854.1 cysteine hydrolase [Psychrobacillus psychrodurans]SFN11783.1 Nicotinamidase-related amidase [Psychrobacillus psychrodurans]
MKALLVIDAQNIIVEFKDFQQELNKIDSIIQDFKENDEPVIFIRNIDDDETSPFNKELPSSELHHSLKAYADIVIEKKSPSAFFHTELSEKLDQLGVEHLFITGFNTEFCCQFTAIAAYDRGYQVTFIEDATGTVNDEATYEMKELDVKGFVGTVLHWSNVIQVLDIEEYIEEYKSRRV